MAPITLRMEVHCFGCRSKIVKAIMKADPYEVTSKDQVLFLENGNVVVIGRDLNGPRIRQAVERKMLTSVSIVMNPVASIPEPDD
ncbi:hypothetical protein EJB05_48527 [Eragrostis curvula]|uniref:HMA domain-containing protein n=1 Tax=Eragrostis curvula TaxID=38414 RepID=A0A5J9T328_9POAL|nr:hypothetical protein EJB05_48527 [Eragrostis curvula]